MIVTDRMSRSTACRLAMPVTIGPAGSTFISGWYRDGGSSAISLLAASSSASPAFSTNSPPGGSAAIQT